tara:strand:- start:4311 stop:5552 length:1242 start_codon:yes stop_codon:yes gene_type:complete
VNKKNFLISIFTVLVQYYDYHLFGFLAANIAGHFFPDDSSTIQLLNTYLLMSLAMLAKPAGAIIFGKIGDIRGRSNSFRISLIGTAIASTILFVIPSYESIGLISAFLLLICRMAICAFITSGSDGVRIYIYENIDKSRQCLGIGITTLFTQAGSLTASLSAWFFTQNYLPEYSWRFSFLLGGILGLLVLIAMKLTNFSDNKPIKDDTNFEKFREWSLVKIIKSNWHLFLLCLMLAGAIGSTNQFLIIFFGTYNFKILHIIDRSSMQSYISLAIIAYMIFSIIGGYLADKFGRYHITVIASIIVIILSIFLCISLEKMILNEWLFISIAAMMPFITMSSAAILKQSIPVAIRYRLFSLSHAIGSITFSAPTAFISTLLYHKTGITWLPVCYFITMILLISFTLYHLNKSTKYE